MTGYIAIIPAAGQSTRTTAGGQGAATRKQFAPLCGKPVLWHAAQPFLRRADIVQVRIIVDNAESAKLAGAMFDDKRVLVMPRGGETRAMTVANGIADIAAGKVVIIHDAARPCLTDLLLDELIKAAGAEESGGLIAIPLGDAMKRGFAGRAMRTLSRNNKWRAQTPQLFPAGLLLPALKAHPHAADDSAAMEKAGHRPLIVRGRADNIKITDDGDIALAAAILSAREKDKSGNNKAATTKAATKPATKATKKPAAKKPAAKKATKGK